MKTHHITYKLSALFARKPSPQEVKANAVLAALANRKAPVTCKYDALHRRLTEEVYGVRK